MITTAVPSPQPCRPSGRRGVRAGLLTVAVLALTACPGATVPAPPTTAAAPSASLARPKLVPAPPRSPLAAAMPAATDPAPPRPATDAPLSLVGISQQQARTLLGTPAATTEEASAIVWDYGGRGCGLRLFFFMDVTAHDFRTLSYETTDAGTDAGNADQCLARLAAQKGN